MDLEERLLSTVPTVALRYEIRRQQPEDRVGRAFQAVFMNRTSYSGIMTAGPLGGRDQKKNKITDRWRPKKIVRDLRRARDLLLGRLEVASVDGAAYVTCMLEEDPNGLFYCDPPYLKDGWQLYREIMTAGDHARLAAVLRRAPRFVLSYDDCREVRELYSWAFITPVETVYTAAKTRGAKKRPKRREVVITRNHPAPVAAMQGGARNCAGHDQAGGQAGLRGGGQAGWCSPRPSTLHAPNSSRASISRVVWRHDLLNDPRQSPVMVVIRCEARTPPSSGAALAIAIAVELPSTPKHARHRRFCADELIQGGPAMWIRACFVVLLACGTMAASAQAEPEVVEANGVVVPSREATLAALETGALRELSVRVGDVVEAGQILARTDSREAELEVTALRTELEAAKVEVELAKTQIQARETDASYRRQIHELVKGRFASGVASEEELSRAAAADAEARAALGIARLELLRAQVGAQRAEVALQATQLRLENTSIRAPFGGVVLEVHAAIGESVLAHRTPVVTVIDVSRLYVQTRVRDARACAPGAAVEVSVELEGERSRFKGRVERAEPLHDPETWERKVWVAVDEAATSRLVPGHRVHLRILVEEED